MYGQATVEAQGGASVGFATKVARWAGRVVSALVVAFLLFDGSIKVMMLEPAVEGSVQLGYPEATVFGIGLALLVSTALYAFPRTMFLGAILLTGYLGGAVATQVRVEDPWFLFPAFVGALVWGGLFLRDGRVRALVSR
jgi:hypothetical protein